MLEELADGQSTLVKSGNKPSPELLFRKISDWMISYFNSAYLRKIFFAGNG